MKVDKNITDKNLVLMYTLFTLIAGVLLFSLFWD